MTDEVFNLEIPATAVRVLPWAVSRLEHNVGNSVHVYLCPKDGDEFIHARGKNVILHGYYYDMLMAAAPSWAPLKPAGKFIDTDLLMCVYTMEQDIKRGFNPYAPVDIPLPENPISPILP